MHCLLICLRYTVTSSINSLALSYSKERKVAIFISVGTRYCKTVFDKIMVPSVQVVFIIMEIKFLWFITVLAQQSFAVDNDSYTTLERTPQTS